MLIFSIKLNKCAYYFWPYFIYCFPLCLQYCQPDVLYRACIYPIL
jgi:hypothetical protein